ncbi:hypothetical protein GCM10028805_05710 [Spirosoma harenae]
MNAFHFLSNPVADALGWTLLHAIWQGFALVLPVAVLLHVFRNRSSALRYQLGVFTLLAQLVASIITFFWCYKPSIKALPNYGAKGLVYPVRWQTMVQTVPWHQQAQQFLEAHLSQFVLVYLIGVGLFGLRLAGGWIYLQRLSQTATQPATKGWAQLTNRLRSDLAIRTLVRVRESARIAVPMVVGMMKPVLLLPIGLSTHLSMREIEAVLAHELAHIKRHDYAVNLLQSVVEVLYFFHPALWWLSARVREEREHCCDDLAVEVCGGDGRILAQALARIEELRLIQQQEAPSLAMAFASKRQHLLHRVRRVLGVQTRPFISNGSLAGLTLVTILLMSVSVYAVQKQDKPAKKTTQPKPNRKHKVDNNSEYGMAGNKQVSYVIWKGQKLPSAHIAKLQSELDGVMAGKLSLDNIPQTDRDILLTIIEKNQAFDGGMDALAEGLSHIDYSNIVASALKDVPLSPDGTVEGLAKVNYQGIINDAFASISQPKIATDSLDRLRVVQQRRMDSLSQLMQQQSRQIQALQLQMEKMQFPVEESERSQQLLEFRKQKLMEQRIALIEKQRRAMYQDGKQKQTLEEVEKQVAALEPEIKKQEASIQEVNQQLEAAQTKMLEARKPLEKLEQETRLLDEQLERMSQEMGRQGERMARISTDLSNMNLNLNINTDGMRYRPASPRKASRSPRAVRTGSIIYAPGVPTPLDPVAAPDVPAAVAHPPVNVRVAPVVTPAAPSVPAIVPAAPTKVTTPRAKPKTAVAPKPEERK